MKIFPFILSMLILVYVLPIAYLAWFRPKKLITLVKYRRVEISNNPIAKIMSPWINILGKYPNVDVIGYRLISFFIILVCLILIIFAFRGPFYI